jgi:hypothetical protein
LEDLRDLKAVKDAQKKGIYRDYSLVRRGLMARRAESLLVIEAIGDRKDIYR